MERLQEKHERDGSEGEGKKGGWGGVVVERTIYYMIGVSGSKLYQSRKY